MKPSKAKEIIDLNIKEAGKQMPPDTLAALKLISEIAGWFIAYRLSELGSNGILLPGETKE